MMKPHLDKAPTPPQRAMLSSITFEKVTFKHKEALFHWLEEPHIKEFWDNTPEHKEDISIFMEGRIKPSPYWEGIFTY